MGGTGFSPAVEVRVVITLGLGGTGTQGALANSTPSTGPWKASGGRGILV